MDTSILSTEARLALAPETVYRHLVEQGRSTGWGGACRRLALLIGMVAIVASVTVTGRVAIGSTAGALPLALFIIGLQLVIASAIVALAPGRLVPFGRAVDLLFAGFVPWALWLFALTTWALIVPASFDVYLAGALSTISAAWSSVVLSAFARVVLGATRRRAVLLTATHQVVTWIVTLSYVAWAAGGWFQLTPW
jgi:hypothetical protein